jgi:hypothetical protein
VRDGGRAKKGRMSLNPSAHHNHRRSQQSNIEVLDESILAPREGPVSLDPFLPGPIEVTRQRVTCRSRQDSARPRAKRGLTLPKRVREASEVVWYHPASALRKMPRAERFNAIPAISRAYDDLRLPPLQCGPRSSGRALHGSVRQKPYHRPVVRFAAAPSIDRACGLGASAEDTGCRRRARERRVGVEVFPLRDRCVRPVGPRRVRVRNSSIVARSAYRRRLAGLRRGPSTSVCSICHPTYSAQQC